MSRLTELVAGQSYIGTVMRVFRVGGDGPVRFISGGRIMADAVQGVAGTEYAGETDLRQNPLEITFYQATSVGYKDLEEIAPEDRVIFGASKTAVTQIYDGIASGDAVIFDAVLGGSGGLVAVNVTKLT
jgi:hypothetical protein